MGKIYNNQPFKIELSYLEIPAGAASFKIEYVNPYGETGSFTASHNAAEKVIFYNSATAETLEISGPWKFWSLVTDATGNEYPGEPITIQIHTRGF